MKKFAKPLRVGLIGAGMVSQYHLSAWAKIPRTEVVAIADPDLARAERRATAFGIERTFRSAEQLIAQTAPDALDIAAPVEHHGALCRIAAENNIAILCQKPLAATFVEAEKIVTSTGKRVRFMVHENWRFRPHYRRIKSWLDEGLIGELGLVRMRLVSSGLIANDEGIFPALARQSFFADMPRFLVFEVLIHHLDVLGYLLGDLKVTAAALTRISNSIRAEDSAIVLLEAANRLPVLLEGGFVVPGATSGVCDHVEIIGSNGVIRLCDNKAVLTGLRNEKHDMEFETMYGASFDGALSEFVAGLSENRPFESEVDDNLKALKLVEDIYETSGWGANSTMSKT